MGSDRSDDATVPCAPDEVGAAPSTAPQRARDEIAPPLAVGRYRLLERLGGGGQGVVHLAHDPDLDRRVAIKMLRSDGGADARARLLREATALAQLSHPNVVGVNDVGTCAAGVYVVTELVTGVTVAQWLERPRTWRRILDVFVAAGRGLAAAHARGIVHRDFKPANVIVGEDGSVRLLDFGLARATPGEEPSDPGATSGPVHGEGTLTVPGYVMGTPAYMAPEQHEGAPATPAADQYAFCVSLFEALWGARPFAGSDASALGRAKRECAPPDLRSPCSAPARLRRIVARGLAPDPQRRWRSMPELLEALVHARRSGRRGALVLAGAGVLAVAGAWILAVDRGACSDAARAWAEVWSSARAERLGGAFAATGLELADGVADRVRRRMDAYVEAWSRERVDACGSTSRANDVRIACLDRLRNDADELLAVLERADGAMVVRAVEATAALDEPRRCSAAEVAEPPAAIAEQAARLSDEVARARALERAGAFAAALEVIEPVAQAADELDHAPLVAEAALVLGSVERELAAPDRGIAPLERAFLVAEAAAHDRVAFEAALELAYAGGIDREDGEGARRWLRHGEVVLARLDGEHRESVSAGRLAIAVADAHMSAGEYAEALVEAQRGIDLLASADLVDGRTADAVLVSAQALVRLARFEEAEAAARRGLELAEAVGGADHPITAGALTVLGMTLKHQGRFADALAMHERALSIRERAYGRDDPNVATSLMMMGVLYSELARNVEAERAYRRALEIQRDKLGPDDPAVARTLHNLAITLRDVGKPEEAIAIWHEAIAIGERSLGSEHVLMAAFLGSLGAMMSDMGRAREAIPLCERALAIREKTHGPDHPAVAESRLMLGHAQRRAGELIAARTNLERGWRLTVAARGEDHVESARALHEFARVVAEQGDYPDALAKQRRALEILERGLGENHPILVEVIGAVAELEARLHNPAEAQRLEARARAVRAAQGPAR